MTGDENYLQTIKNYLQLAETRIKLFAHEAPIQGKPKRIGNEILESQRQNDWYRRMDRNEVYAQFPEYKYYQKIVFNMHKAFEYRFEKVLSDESYLELKKLLGGIDFKQYLFNEELIKLDPSQNLNQAYWLSKLGLADLLELYLARLLDTFPLSSLKKDALEFHNQIYSYTHIVIVASEYYQNYVDPESHNQYTEFFSRHFEHIMAHGSTDMLAEIGIALRLTQSGGELLDRIKKVLMARFNGSYISFGDHTDLNKLQHTNMLAIMVLGEFSQLHPGPYFNTSQKEER
ncbi:MAG: DUF3541 domain-containing protein [Candidatus Dojkabacteria bacterium]